MRYLCEKCRLASSSDLHHRSPVGVAAWTSALLRKQGSAASTWIY